MRIYQLKTAVEFLNYIKDSNPSQEQLMQMYAEHVAKKFAAECVNEALGNKMEVSNSLHHAIEEKYRSIIWENEDQILPTDKEEITSSVSKDSHISKKEGPAWCEEFKPGDTIRFDINVDGRKTGETKDFILTEEWLQLMRKWESEENYHNMRVVRKKQGE